MNGSYKIGDIVLQHWKLTRILGEGSFGKVFEAEREDFGKVYKAAIKIIVIPKDKAIDVAELIAGGITEETVSDYYKDIAKKLSEEFATMSELKGHTNIVSYEDHAVIPHTDGVGWDIIIRMELLEPFSEIIKKENLSRREVIKLGIDICQALEVCRKHNIIHRDIKPANIFRTKDGNYKLGDFGVSRTMEGTVGTASYAGSPNYMAPEVCRYQPYGATADIYSLGIVLYSLLNNTRIPFLPEYPKAVMAHDREEALNRRIGGEKIPYPSQDHGKLADIVLKACAYNPSDRYATAEEMRKDLEQYLEALASVIGEETLVLKQKLVIEEHTVKEKGKISEPGSVTENTTGIDGGKVDPPGPTPPPAPPKKPWKLILALLLMAGIGFGIYSVLRDREPDDAKNQASTTSTPVMEPVLPSTPTPAEGTAVPMTQTPAAETVVPPTPTQSSEMPADTRLQTTEPSPSPHVHLLTDATCTEPKTCSECGETEGRPLGHLWQEATCTEPQICSRCGETKGEPLGHVEMIDPAVEPTCTEDGFTEGTHCTVCNKILVAQKTVDALGHDYMPASCTAPQTCARCGATRGVMLAHNWQKATCTEPKTCTVCGTTEGEPFGHTPVKDESLAPTCTETGLSEGSHCSACGEVLEPQEVIAALAHDWAEAAFDAPKTCRRCGITEGEVVELPAPEITQISINAINEPYLVWETIPGVKTYHIYKSLYIERDYEEITSTVATSKTVPDCEAGKTYYFKVRAEMADGNLSELSEPVSVTIPAEKSLLVGDFITFGSYEQDNDTSNGKEDIEWQGLDVQDGKALLISKYALDCQQYHSSYASTTWERCTLRSWLNGIFLEAALSTEEQKQILATTVTADKNPRYSTDPGIDTTDKIFLLSITEANEYFSRNSERQCRPTAFAIANGAYESSSSGNCWWWLRTPGIDKSGAAYILTDGAVYSSGNFVNVNNYAVRPAMWLDLGF